MTMATTIPALQAATRPWQPWERNFSGGRIGVQEQQGANENWMIIHVESGGVKTTTSLRHHEAWDFALMVSPQLKAEFGRQLDEIRKLYDALHHLICRQTDTDLLRQIADDHTCGDSCEYGGGQSLCPRIDDTGCKFAEADNLRSLAQAIDTANESAEADILRAIDSCGGAPDINNPEWSRGYDDALAVVEREVKRMFARSSVEA